MKKLITVLFGSFLFFINAEAQLTRHVVKLKNKGNNPFSLNNPSAYLSQRAIDRRTKYGIAIDSTDLPVTPSYISQIDNVPNVSIINISKWLNSVTILTTDVNAINSINTFPFVQSVAGIAARIANANPANKFFTEEHSMAYNHTERTAQTTADFFNYGTGSFNEINIHKGQFLHNIGLRGQGMQIAMFDNGYNNYTTLKAFDSANANAQILGTWDFVSAEQNVINDGSHGMQCFSTIVANIPGQFIGTAPKANFWLYKTEDDSGEYPIEEHHWACGAEKADSSGADVITSSLGYGYDFDGGFADYPRSSIDGNTTMSAIAADLAAKKGMLVFVSAGNAGNIPWHFITTPSDGDSVIAVGAVSISGVVGSFSSYGPSGDGQIKPDVAGVGVAAMIQSTSNTIVTGNGTSYSGPKMAGLGSILWQAFPEFNNMKIRTALQQAGNLFATPDDRIGYGIPDLKKAFSNLLVEYATSGSTINGCRIFINWTSKDVSAMKYEVERKAPGELSFSKIADINPVAGNNLSVNSYQFINTLATGTSGSFSYRIRQIIDTAVASFADVYIDTTSVNVSSPCIVTGVNNPPVAGNMLLIKPNPVTNNTAILIIETPDAITNMPVVIYDMNGRLVMRMQQSKGSGQSIFTLPIGKLAKGKYVIKVYNKTKPIGAVEMIKL